VLAEPVFVSSASLLFPKNKAAPIAASIELRTPSNLQISSQYDWRQSGNELWNIEFETKQGKVEIKHGGANLLLDGLAVEGLEHSEYGEYEAIYAHFADLIQSSKSDVDLAPLKLVADAFLMGDREVVDAF